MKRPKVYLSNNMIVDVEAIYWDVKGDPVIHLDESWGDMDKVSDKDNYKLLRNSGKLDSKGTPIHEGHILISSSFKAEVGIHEDQFCIYSDDQVIMTLDNYLKFGECFVIGWKKLGVV